MAGLEVRPRLLYEVLDAHGHDIVPAFDELAKAYTILLAAVDMSRKCEPCAGAIITDGYCAVHRVKYDGGQPVSGTPP